MMTKITFTSSVTSGNRKHFIGKEDVEMLLSRLPEELWSRLRGVHFNDRSWGNRTLGYVNRGRREIAIVALPHRVSLNRCFAGRTRFASLHGSPREFGAERRRQWPELAIRRFMLYEVFLHELGHLQIVHEKARVPKRRFAGETCANEFAARWRNHLWSQPFDHSDPIHNRALEIELFAPTS